MASWKSERSLSEMGVGRGMGFKWETLSLWISVANSNGFARFAGVRCAHPQPSTLFARMAALGIPRACTYWFQTMMAWMRQEYAFLPRH
jgi:hypothetical protein